MMAFLLGGTGALACGFDTYLAVVIAWFDELRIPSTAGTCHEVSSQIDYVVHCFRSTPGDRDLIDGLWAQKIA